MRRVVLAVTIVLVTVTTAFGCWMLLAGDGDPTRRRLLWTMGALTVASLLALSCARAWEVRRLRPLAVVGTLLCAAAGWMIVERIWEADSTGGVRESSRWTFTVAVLAATAAHASLLGSAIVGFAARIVRVATVTAGVLLAAGAIHWNWADRPVDERTARWLGVLGLLLAAGTVIVSILQRPQTVEGTTAPPRDVGD